MKLNPGNIWSGNRQLAVFTNPTELAFKKGNLRNHYPVFYNDRLYPDAEAAFQRYSRGIKHDFEICKNICLDILLHKFEQYPILQNTIKESGGTNWILKCRHVVGARTQNFKRWEGVGRNSAFIDCLYRAFEHCLV